MNGRALIVSAPRSGSGKTVITLALLAALRRRGIKVGPAKAGPDYIDAGFHAAATGAAGLNLATEAMGPPPPVALSAPAAATPHLLALGGVLCPFPPAAR